MRVLILHGYEGNTPDHWQTWLAGRLRENGHDVVSPDLPALTAALQSAGMAPRPAPGVPAAMVVDAEPAAVGHAAFAAGVELHELSRAGQSLEDVFLDLTGERAPATAAPPPSGAPTAGAVA